MRSLIEYNELFVSGLNKLEEARNVDSNMDKISIYNSFFIYGLERIEKNKTEGTAGNIAAGVAWTAAAGVAGLAGYLLYKHLKGKKKKRQMELDKESLKDDGVVWRTTKSGHVIGIDTKGKVKKGNPEVVQKLKAKWDKKVEKEKEKIKKQYSEEPKNN